MPENMDETLRHFDLKGDALVDLRAVGKIATPMLDEVLGAFYDYALKESSISSFFSDDGLVQHARNAQKEHWKKLFTGEFSPAYVASAKSIGQVHYRIKLPFQYYLAGYARAATHIQRLVMEKAQRGVSVGKQKKLISQLSVLSRAFMLDTQLVTDGVFDAQSEEVACAMGHLNAGVKRMANRDFSQSIKGPEESDYPALYDDVRIEFNSSMKDLRDLFGVISNGVTGISGHISGITDVADDLARRTELQAATLEETAAALDEITKSQAESADATQQTDAVVRDTRANAKSSESVVEKAVMKIDEIARSSEEITQITNVLDDIAFQTNLLALNAGVEAARAGDAGLGFAVVATEVRNLALRATESASEIKNLVNSSTLHVKSGVEYVSATGIALGEIVSSVTHAAELVTEISSSAQMQTLGFQEINSGVAELDKATQRTAGIADQAISAVEAARADILGLTNLIDTFKMEPEGRNNAGQIEANRAA